MMTETAVWRKAGTQFRHCPSVADDQKGALPQLNGFPRIHTQAAEAGFCGSRKPIKDM